MSVQSVTEISHPPLNGLCIYEVNRVHSDSSRSAVTEMHKPQESFYSLT